jgi:putative toxin-antitoxin system antitoxin component (TIGR02293 family)
MWQILYCRMAKPGTRVSEPAVAYGARPGSTAEVITQLKSGLEMAAFDRLSRRLDILPSELADLTHIARRTFARRKQEGRLQLAESERVYRLNRLLDRAVEVLGSENAARAWLKSPARSLSGITPLDYSDTEIGAREVEDLLGRLEHGVFS